MYVSGEFLQNEGAVCTSTINIVRINRKRRRRIALHYLMLANRRNLWNFSKYIEALRYFDKWKLVEVLTSNPKKQNKEQSII